MGIDSRAVTPGLTSAVVHLAAEIRSFERVEKTTQTVLGHKVPRSTVRRLAKQVGAELAALEESSDQTDDQEVVTPQIAVISCDGGRIRTREPGQGRGVRLSNGTGWRETKNASLERMCLAADHRSDEDPCPRLPTSFHTVAKVANISEKPALNVTDSTTDTAHDERDRVSYAGPRRVLRTAVSSMACSDDFGPMMRREADRRRLDDAPLKAFIADGLNWNWSIWKKHFPKFTPILDFIHAIQYVFSAALVVHSNEARDVVMYQLGC